MRTESAAEEKERSLRLAKAREEPQVTVKITEKTTKMEVDWWRLAHSRSASEQETTEAAIMFFRSVRLRNSRYVVRELGIPKTLLKDYDSRPDYNAGVFHD